MLEEMRVKMGAAIVEARQYKDKVFNLESKLEKTKDDIQSTKLYLSDLQSELAHLSSELLTRLRPEEVGSALNARFLECIRLCQQIVLLIDPQFSINFFDQRNKGVQRRSDLRDFSDRGINVSVLSPLIAEDRPESEVLEFTHRKKMRPPKRPIHALMVWIRRQPPKVKAFLAVVSGMAALVLLRVVVRDHDNLFVAAEAVHAIGISVLIYKLMKEKTCAGLSLKSQDLTAIFLAVRLYCSFVMEFDVHTLLDSATLATTLWVIYMIRFKLKSTYMEDKDNFATYYVLVPCAVLALLVHPSTSHHIVNRILWAFCVYLEAVSVLPQLRVMQNTKIVEPFTAHYVFALGVARFLSCAHWVLQVLDTRGHLLTALGYGLWPSLVLISEIVQTFILADFCYYYVKSVLGGQLVLRLPSGFRFLVNSLRFFPRNTGISSEKGLNMKLDTSGLESTPPLFGGCSEDLSDGFLTAPSFKIPNTSDFDGFQKEAIQMVKPAKGTTTLAFIFREGVMVAADSRASMGGYISSQSVKKIIEINPYMLGTMAGGAADCQFWHRNLGIKCRLHELANKQRISVTGASKLLANILYSYRGMGLSVGTMIAGWDVTGPGLYYVDSEGGRLKGTRFSVGSGSPYAYGVLDNGYRYDMTIEEAAELARRAIYHATFRDGASGGVASVYHVGPNGWKKLSGDDVGELHYQYYPVTPNTVEQEMADVTAA
ncbi:hypothetical protein Nepgr_004830 [Nepenthes gracilis]|uniref:proteasome endopeptidase complex n=1 Tax=Nepenthes gracilis TaxID=150966 RepID=A0AAD3S2J5_NEPGR|nr:hypothetical protein Nepgr_004830 [Nepenthes gracilis]